MSKKTEQDYWRDRFKQLEEAQNRKGRECYEEIEEIYNKAIKKIEAKIAIWYQRFADNNNIDLTEARKILTLKELEELKWDVQEYIKYGKENDINEMWIKELENASARYHVTRYEALKLQIQQQLEVIYDNKLDIIDRTMRSIYKDRYYKTAFEIEKGLGVGYDFATIDQRKIDKVIKTPWAVDGKNFSERIWGDKQKLIKQLQTEMTTSMITGESPHKLIDRISRKLNVSKKETSRLVMTEQAYFSSVAQKDCFNELDVEQYEIVATLDSSTSDICRELDGKTFPMSQYEAGVTAPPFHVYCRSVTVPYFGDEFDTVGKRAERGTDGKTHYVDSNMTYEEWIKKRKIKNSKNDAKDRFGILSNNKKSDKRYYDFKNKSIDIVEDEISKLDYEIGVIFKDGKAINCQLGAEDSILFTKHQLKMMKGNDVTHNHPLSTPPSPEDLYLLVKYKAKSFRTCGKNGVYVLEYNEAIKNLPDFESFSESYNNALYELKTKYREKVRNGMNENDALIALAEEIWEELYKLYGVKPIYERR